MSVVPFSGSEAARRTRHECPLSPELQAKLRKAQRTHPGALDAIERYLDALFALDEATANDPPGWTS